MQTYKSKTNNLNNFLSFIEGKTDLYKLSSSDFPWYKVVSESLRNSLPDQTKERFSKKSAIIRSKDFLKKLSLINSTYDYAFIVKAKMRRKDPNQFENNLFVEIFDYLLKNKKKFIIFEVPSGEPYDLKYFKSEYCDITIPFEYLQTTFYDKLKSEIANKTNIHIENIKKLFENYKLSNKFENEISSLKNEYKKLLSIIPRIVICKHIFHRMAIKALCGGMGTHLFSGFNNSFSIIEVEHGYHGNISNKNVNFSSDIYQYYHSTFDYDNFYVLSLSNSTKINTKNNFCFKDNCFNFGMPEIRKYQFSKENLNQLKLKYRLKDEKVVLILTNGHINYQKIDAFVQQILQNASNIKVLFRPHPSYDNISCHTEFMRSLPIVSDEHLYDLLCISDIVVSPSSSVVTEASCFTDFVVVYPNFSDGSESQTNSLSERYPLALPHNLNSNKAIVKWIDAIPKKKRPFTNSFDTVQPKVSLKKLFRSIEDKIQPVKKSNFSIHNDVLKKQKIIIVTDEFPVLTETFIFDQVNGLLDRNVSVEIWTRKINKNLLDSEKISSRRKSLRINKIKLPPDDIRPDIRRWRDSFFHLNPNINLDSICSIHVHFGWNFNILQPLLQTVNTRIVVSFHGNDSSAFIKKHGSHIFAKLFDRADIITTPSYVMKESLRNSGCPSEKIQVHRCGIDVSNFSPSKRQSHNSEIVLLTVGRLVEKKGIEYALRAFSEIPRNIRATYRIIGDGPLRQNLVKLASQLSIQDRVVFLGAKSHEDVQREMSQADIFILTSVTASNGDQEGLPVGLIEAQAMGLPVISSKHAGIPELVDHQKSGFLADEKSVDQIAGYLRTLICDPKMRAEFSVNARNIALEHFNIEALNDRLASYLTRNAKENDSKPGSSQCCQSPSISIVIPTHKRPGYLKQAIESAVVQESRLTDTEILIVSDGYDNETEGVVNGYSSHHIRYITKEHSGAVGTRNRAIDEAKGDYILWLDDDDILEPTTVTSYLETLSRHPRADVIYGILEYFDDRTGNTLRYFDPTDWSIKPKALLGALSGGCRIPNPATLIRKSAYQEVGKYDPNFRRAHDYEFWSRAAESLSFKKCNSIVCRYRVHTNNMSVGDGVDFSYESLIIRKMADRYGARNLFPGLDWRDSRVAEYVAKYIMAKNLFRFGDYYNCSLLLNNFPHDLSSKEVVELQFFSSLYQGVPNNPLINSALTDNNIKAQYDLYERLNRKLKKSINAKSIQQCIQNLNEYRKNNLSPSVDLLFEAGTYLIARGEKQIAKNIVAKACMIHPEAVAANERMLDKFDASDRESIHGTIQRVLSPEGLNRFSNTIPKQIIRVDSPAESVSVDDAVLLYESENYRTASDVLLTYTALHPRDWSAYALWVDVLLQSGQASVIPEQLHALEGRTDLPPFMLALIGSGYEAAGDLAKAADYAERALAADAVCAPAWNLKGVLAFRNGELDQAAMHFHTAIENNENWGEPWTNLGTVYWEQDHHKKALESMEKGFSISPTAPNVATTYHAAVSETGQYEHAKPLFESVVERHPDFKKARYLLIDLLIRLERYVNALAQIESLVVRFGPDAELLQAAKVVRAKVGPMAIKKGKCPSLSLCMIVKNEEKYLPRCLENLKLLADEMIVVDTGSTDATRDIAEVFGAKVFDFEWRDDFAAARNHSLEKASGDWILVMDADEIIASKDHNALVDLLKKHDSDSSAAYVLITRNYTDRQDDGNFIENIGEYEAETGTGWIPSKKVRLFQNNRNIHFVYPVHELVDPILAEMGIPLIESTVPVHHFGKLDQARTSERWQMYYNLGKEKLASQVDNDHALKELAIQSGLLSKWEEAATHWKVYLDRNPGSIDACLNLTRVMAKRLDFGQANQYARKAFELSANRSETIYNLALSELQTGQAAKAAQTAAQMVAKFPDDTDGRLLHALSEICAGNLDEGSKQAERLAKTVSKEVLLPRVLSIIASVRSAGFDDWVTTLVTVLYKATGLREITYPTTTTPKIKSDSRLPSADLPDGNPSILFDRANQCYEKEDFHAAFDLLLHIIAIESNHWESYRLLAEVLLQSEQASAIPEQLQALEGRSDLPPQMLALIGSGYEAADDLVKAADYADQAMSRAPDCAQAWNLKGVLAFRNGDRQMAAQYFHAAIENDPNWGEPWTNLGTVYWEQDRHNKALDALEKGCSLAPTAPNVATAYHAAVCETDQYERAQDCFTNIVEGHPDFKKARYLLIDILIRLERYADALAHIESLVVRFGPNPQLLEAAKTVRAKVGPITLKKGKHPSLSLCMIVKNEEKYLPRCLESLKPLVDEMIIVDTGSSDATRDIAEVFGAKVFDFEWNDDFAAARNHSLEQATGDWILVMDADEIIAAKDHKKIHNLLKKSTKGKIAYTITTRNYTRKYNGINWQPNDSGYADEEVGCGWIPSTKTRLFKNTPEIRFEYPVHELVDPALDRNGYKIKQCNVPVHHYGLLEKSKVSQKGGYYYEIGKRKLEKMENDPNAIYELAVGANLQGNQKEAIKLWSRVAELQPNNARVFINLSAAHAKLGDFQKAKFSALNAVKIAPKFKEGHYNLGRSEFFLGNFIEAQKIFKRIVRNDETSYSARFMLGATHICCGNIKEGTASFLRLKSLNIWSSLPHAFEALAMPLSEKGFESQAKELIRFSKHLDNLPDDSNPVNNDDPDRLRSISDKLSLAS